MKRAPAGGLDTADKLRRFLVELNRLELASQLVFIIKPTSPRRSGFDLLKMLRCWWLRPIGPRLLRSGSEPLKSFSTLTEFELWSILMAEVGGFVMLMYWNQLVKDWKRVSWVWFWNDKIGFLRSFLRHSNYFFRLWLYWNSSDHWFLDRSGASRRK